MRARTSTAAAFLVGLVFIGSPSPAQQPRFEVASVKRNTSSPPRSVTFPHFQGTTFTALNVPVEMLISTAYGVPSRDLMEMPQWIQLDMNGGERYDVIARAADGSSVQDQRAMLRSLLEERFGLRVRRETRQLPVYVLTRLNEQGVLGPNLRNAVKTCPPPAPACEGRIGAGGASGKGAQWSTVLQAIGGALDGRLVDRTGLSGVFDFELTYIRGGLSVTGSDSGVDIFGAVRQQLGLKLEPSRAPFEITVIESVSRPTPD